MARPITEAQHQRALVQWWAWACKQYKLEPRHLMHIPNEGKRSAVLGNMMKAEGLRRGVPDLFLAVPCGKFSGLWLEMKSEKGRPTPDQMEYLMLLTKAGYDSHVCYGWEDARNCIENYLKLNEGTQAVEL